MNSIEGVDYIFDRYAYLGLAPTASTGEIHRTIVRRRAGLHDDKIMNLDPELKEKAEKVREAVNRCADMLEDEGKRALYDQRLEHFKAEAPHLVSNRPDVTPVDPTRERFDFEGLLNNKDDHYDLLEKKARELTLYDPDDDEKARARYTQNPKNSRARSAYQTQLGKRLQYLTAMEQVVWMGAGFTTSEKTRGFIQAPEDYTEATENAIKHTREHVIAESVSMRSGLVAIGMASPPLLLGYEAAPTAEGKPAMPDDLSQKIIDTVRGEFDLRTQRIRDNAQAKADTLQEIIDLSPTYIFKKISGNSDDRRTVYIFRPPDTAKGEEPSLMITFNFIRQGKTMTSAGSAITDSANRQSLSAVRAQAKKGPPSIGILHDTGLGDTMSSASFYMEVSHALNVLEKTVSPKTAQPG